MVLLVLRSAHVRRNGVFPHQKMKRETWTFDPPDDVKRIVARALRDLAGAGVETKGLRSRVLVGAIRQGLSRYARKKDQV